MVPSHVLGVDLGGTQIRACRADRNGHILREARALTLAVEGPEAVLGRIKETLRDVLEGAGQGSVLGVGVACPGPLDPGAGVVLGPPNLPGWDNIPLRDIIQRDFDLPVFVNNDANLAGLAEFHFGAGRGTSDLVYLTIGTGIGGGIIVGGRLLMGAHGLAGEPGHATVEPDGPCCNCGNVGCLESLSSGPSIARQAADWIRQGHKSVLSQELQDGRRGLTAEMVGKAALDGDEVALRAVARACYYLGIGVLNLIHIFDPQMVVLGGGVSKLGELLFNPVRLWVRDHALTPVQCQTPIVPAGLGDRVGLLGAVAWAFERSGFQMSADM